MGNDWRDAVVGGEIQTGLMSFADVLVASYLFGLSERIVLLLWDHTQQVSACLSGLFLRSLCKAELVVSILR